MGESFSVQLRAQPQPINMLVFLSLLAVASAAPQYLYNYPYPVYPVQHVQQPIYYQPGYPLYQGMPLDVASSRGIFALPGFEQLTASFEAATGRTVSGDVTFKQNPFTGDNSIYQAYINGSNMAGKKYQLGIASSCTATPSNLGNQMTAPSILINGFHVKGSSSTFNINGSGSKTSVKGMVLTVTDDAGTVIGCTAALSSEGPTTIVSWICRMVKNWREPRVCHTPEVTRGTTCSPPETAPCTWVYC